jgi:hypothetical protein
MLAVRCQQLRALYRYTNTVFKLYIYHWGDFPGNSYTETNVHSLTHLKLLFDGSLIRGTLHCYWCTFQFYHDSHAGHHSQSLRTVHIFTVIGQ